MVKRAGGLSGGEGGAGGVAYPLRAGGTAVDAAVVLVCPLNV
jgi:hypothetical protein